MKKNDENQNNDSGMTRRVYKKASLDDTVVNVRKDPSDDFDLLSDDGMMDYVPGVDDVDHFDFDEKDIEHYRKVIACCKAQGVEPIATLLHFTG